MSQNKENIYVQTQTKSNYLKDKKITSKQWQIYYYLMSISKFNSQSIEDHRYVYKDSFNISSAAKFLNITRPTIYTALKKLEEVGLITILPDCYLLYAKNWIEIKRETLINLLNFSKNTPQNIDLLRVYLILKKIDTLAISNDDKIFTKKDLITLLGHNINTTIEYEYIRNYLALLFYFNLIEIKYHTTYKEGLGKYTIYHLQKVNDYVNNDEVLINIAAEMESTSIPEYIIKEINFYI